MNVLQPQDLEEKPLLSSEPAKTISEQNHFRNEPPSNHRKQMSVFPKLPFFQKAFHQIFLQLSVLFVSGRILLQGKRSRTISNLSKSIQFPCSSRPTALSGAMSGSPAYMAVFPTELLKQSVLLQSHLPAVSWHIASAMSEKGDFYLQYLDFELYVSLSSRYYY